MLSYDRADARVPHKPDHPEPARQSVRADWSAYATAYDLLSLHNPAYRALLHDFEAFVATIDTP